jgi:hypothetical protein
MAVPASAAGSSWSLVEGSRANDDVEMGEGEPQPVTRSEAGCGDPEPTWPQARCHTCRRVAHWREMASEKVWQNFQVKKGDAEDLFTWKRTCIPCLSKLEGRPEDEIKLEVLGRPIERKVRRAAQLVTAKDGGAFWAACTAHRA